ncbi:MAG: DNA-binding protein WhiA [Oscillospiraceae bacterium]|nr:DNA-binding protein WhiA [Oscillospiraceae bacterium]
MSFSHDVRECIRNTITDHDRRFACLYGMLLFGRTVTREEICIKSGSEVFRSVFPVLLKTVFGASVPLSIENKPRKDGGMLTIYKIQGLKPVTEIRHTFHIHEERCIDMRNLPTNSMGAFLGGVFLTCGSITDPMKEYHLEYAIPTQQLCQDLCDILYSIGVHPNVMQRKYAWSAYLKASEEIEDFLTFIGAQKCTLQLIEIKINKEVINQINRRNNCDLANIDKTVSASERQCRDIQEIIQHDGLKELSPELQELAQLRLDNPHLSLSELGQMLSKPIGRSGVNHRFQKLAQIAQHYRGSLS